MRAFRPSTSISALLIIDANLRKDTGDDFRFSYKGLQSLGVIIVLLLSNSLVSLTDHKADQRATVAPTKALTRAWTASQHQIARI